MAEKHYLYHMPGMGLDPGDVYGSSEAEARANLRQSHGLTRLPKGTEVWEFTPKLAREREAHLKDFRQQLRGTGLCTTDF